MPCATHWTQGCGVAGSARSPIRFSPRHSCAASLAVIAPQVDNKNRPTRRFVLKMETTTKTPAPTTSDVYPDALTERLLPVLRAALDKARSLGRGVMASLTVDLTAAPSRALLDGLDCFYWEQPSKGVRLAGIGSALDVSAEGADRFERVRAGIGAFFDDDVLEPAGA